MGIARVFIAARERVRSGWIASGLVAGLLVACGGSGDSGPSESGQTGGASGESAAEVGTGISIRGRIDGYPQGMKGVRLLADMDFEKGINPIEVARVEARGLSCAVADDGTFELRNLDEGRVYLLGAIDATNFSHPLCTDPVEVVAGAVDAKLSFRPGAQISFRVVDDETGEPITKFRVNSIHGSQSRVVSLAPNGRGRNRRHPDGRGTLYNVRPGYDPGMVRLAIVAGGYYRKPIELRDWAAGEKVDLGEIRLESVAELNFVIRDKKTGDPLRGARVILSEIDPLLVPEVDERGIYSLFSEGQAPLDRGMRRVSTRTDELGKCSLTPFSADHLELRVTASLRASYRQRGFVLPESSQTFEIALERSARVSLQVVDAEGVPAGDSWIVFDRPDALAERGPLYSDQEGWVVLPKAWPGKYRFRALSAPLLAPGIDPNSSWDPWKFMASPVTELDVEGGATLEQRVPLGASHPFHGRVTRAGKPVMGASVFVAPFPASLDAELIHALLVRDGRTYPWLAETDEQGLFAVEGVPAGTNFVQVRELGHGHTHFTQVDVQASDPLSEVQLPENWPPPEPRQFGSVPGMTTNFVPLVQKVLNDER